MTGPHGAPAGGSDPTGAPVVPGAAAAERWRAPRWVLLGIPVLLLAGLLALRALLGDGPGEDRRPQQGLPPDGEVSSAEEFAETVLDTWARPELDYDTWWGELEPLLSPGARQAYAHTDPRRVPDLSITGEPEVSAGPTTDTVTVDLQTDAGAFGVALYRGDADSWRAVQIVFPGREGPFR